MDKSRSATGEKKYVLTGGAKMAKTYARYCFAYGADRAGGYSDAIAEMREEIQHILDEVSKEGTQPYMLHLLLTNFQERQDKFLKLIRYKPEDTPDISL